MTKEKFLLVSLEDQQAKQLAEVISNDTSRKIINYLSEKEDATETQLSQALGIPISTVHYNLQKLKEASLVNAETFHYSEKGREVDHYRLANKYVIITPKPVKGIKTQLRNILPVALLLLGASWMIKFMQSFYAKGNMVLQPIAQEVITSPVAQKIAPAAQPVAEALTYDADIIEAGVQMMPKTAEFVAQNVTSAQAVQQEPNIALWFFIGGMVALGLYVLINIVRKR